MKYLAMLGVVAALVVPNAITAQEPPLDVGDASPFVVGCQLITEYAEVEAFVVKNCRRAEPDEIEGNRATIHVRLGLAPSGALFLTAKLHKSLWGLGPISQGG